jgi:UPF0755 protein
MTDDGHTNPGRGRPRHRGPAPREEDPQWPPADERTPPARHRQPPPAPGRQPALRPDEPRGGYPGGPAPAYPAGGAAGYPAGPEPLTDPGPAYSPRTWRGRPGGGSPGYGDDPLPGYRDGQQPGWGPGQRASGAPGGRDGHLPGRPGYPAAGYAGEPAGYADGDPAGYAGDRAPRPGRDGAPRYPGYGMPGYQAEDPRAYPGGDARGYPGGNPRHESPYPGGGPYPGHPGDGPYQEQHPYPGEGAYQGDGAYPGGGPYQGEGSYPDEGHDPAPGRYRGQGRYQGGPPGAPGEDYGNDGRPAEGPPWEDDKYEDGRFVPGLSGQGDGADEGGRAGRGTKRGRRRAAPLIALLVIITPLAVGGFLAFRFVQGKYFPADYSGDGSGQVVAQVQSGESAAAVGQGLVALGVVASARAFQLAAEHSTNQTGLEPGFYRLHKHMKASLAFALMLSPSARVQKGITIPEGWRISQIVAALGARSGISAADFQKALSAPGSLGLPAYANGKPEGYLFPATYDIQPNMTATAVLQAMVQRFNTYAASINLTGAAAQANLTPSQLVIVASLLQAEGGRIPDYPKIARVVYNRLAAGMPLQFDSTVLYGLGKFGTAATYAQLQSQSPYNTYRYKGLPPGPIDSPGNAAIQAALHPASGSWLYFVSGKDGVTRFSDTLSGLNG